MTRFRKFFGHDDIVRDRGKVLDDSYLENLTDAKRRIIPFDRVNPIDMALCVAIADRYARFVIEYVKRTRGTDLECDRTTLLAHIVCAHVSRDLDLKAFFETDDLKFCDTMFIIVKNINVPLASFPHDVKLPFARKF